MTQPTIKEKKGELSIVGIPGERRKKNQIEIISEKIQTEMQQVLDERKRLAWEDTQRILERNLRDFARLICEDILKHDDEFGFATEMHRRRALEEKCQEILKALE